MADPPVSVVLVNYQGGDLLAACLGALARQTFSRFEAIVVDNGSSDGSAAAVPRDDARFQLIELGHNSGFAAASNRGLERSRGAWVALLNPDAIPAPDWLARLLAAAEAHPDFSAFGSHQLSLARPELLDGTGDVLSASGLAWRRDQGLPSELGVSESDEIFGPCAAAALYARDALVAAGGLDEEFFCYYEDVDLALRLRLAGHRALHVADAVVHHGAEPSDDPPSDFQLFHSYRNLTWAWFQNMPLDLLLRNLHRHLALHVRALVGWTLKGRPGVILRAQRAALAGLPARLRRRRALRDLRRAPSREIARWLSPRPRRSLRESLAALRRGRER